MIARDTVLRAGALCFYDTFAGLVPCRALRVYYAFEWGALPRLVADVKLTATRGAYRRGETLRAVSSHYVVPRGAVRVRSGQFRIGAYTVETCANG